MKRPLGCLSGVGLIAALLALLVVGGVIAATGGVLFSPGPLNAQAGDATLGGVASHAETRGDCAACHTPPWSHEGMADRCAGCHTAMADPNSHLAQFHELLWRDTPEQPCRACHPEHRGATASLTDISVTDFPHDATDFSLAAHRKTAAGNPFTCADCHADNLTAFEVATCDTCHAQLDAGYMAGHRQDFGAQCLSCHDGADRFSAFDHSQTPFALTGAHADVRCGECHTAAAPADFANAPKECIGCHQEDDAHQGGLGTDCAACHTPDQWENATFDHARTAFPLQGKHAEVKCEQCHAGGKFKGTPTDCVACHEKDDAHEGQFGTDCAGCHTPDDWENATFDHAKTAFPLTGAHQQVKCEQCHAGGKFKGTATACSGCHQDPAFHRGLFAQTCDACHTTTAWQPARFDLPHTFPINHGEGGPSPCRTCHPDALAQYTCYGCHEHNPAEIQEEHAEEGIGDIANCIKCHPTGQEEEGGED